MPDGSETVVQPFERTKALEVLKLLDSVALDQFLIESEYEVWSDEEDIPGLLKFAEYLSSHDKVAVSRLSFGRGFTEYYALLRPNFQEGKFELVMHLTKMRKEYQHLLPIVNAQVRVPVKTVSLLPEI